ncbi:MAG: transposase [Thiotrichaceae bacterium]
MARLPRIVIPDQPLHIMHRGNNRQNIFESEEDMLRIIDDLTISLEKSSCSLHAYVIMTNHLHLLVTPKDKVELSGFMQSVANRYVRYYNAQHNRTGTIWEGRFKSCLVDSDYYLLTLYRYIEMNPVRSGMVESMSDYCWSSYHHNALGEMNSLITEHERYINLASNKEERLLNYQALFDSPTRPDEDNKIAMATMKGEVYGSEVFHEKVSQLAGRITRLGAHGGDRKSEKYHNQAG